MTWLYSNKTLFLTLKFEFFRNFIYHKILFLLIFLLKKSRNHSLPTGYKPAGCGPMDHSSPASALGYWFLNLSLLQSHLRNF